MPVPSIKTLQLLAMPEAERMETIREALEETQSINDAADRLGVSWMFLRRIVNKNPGLLDGVPLHGPGPKTLPQSWKAPKIPKVKKPKPVARPLTPDPVATEWIQDALEEHKGVTFKAAQSLGVSTYTLRRWVDAIPALAEKY